MSETPETDKEAKRTDGDYFLEGFVEASFAERLERERDDARALAKMYRNLSCETQCEAERHKLPWDNVQIQQPATREDDEN